MTTQTRATLLDEFMPVYGFSDVQSTVVRATPAQVFEAFRNLTLGEIGSMRPLFWLRALPDRFRRSESDGEASGGMPGPDTLFLDMALGPESFWILLGEEPGQELVLGAVGAFAQPRIEFAEIRTPTDFTGAVDERHAKTALSVRVVPGGNPTDGYTVTMESRTHVPASTTRRRFGW
ncbi:MAG: hypothetical protein R3C39_02495 [Dehalococcoidia bacterium]